jgi:uncharacterized repeat protein (TIGR01451 family)
VATAGVIGNDPGPVIGDIAADLLVPAGGNATCTATCSLDSAATGLLDNTATVSFVPTSVRYDPAPGNDFATDMDTIVVEANLGISKTDGVTVTEVGSEVTYTIVVTSAGPSDAPDTVVTDVIPDDCLLPSSAAAREATSHDQRTVRPVPRRLNALSLQSARSDAPHEQHGREREATIRFRPLRSPRGTPRESTEGFLRVGSPTSSWSCRPRNRRRRSPRPRRRPARARRCRSHRRRR